MDTAGNVAPLTNREEKLPGQRLRDKAPFFHIRSKPVNFRFPFDLYAA
jgi:hypothetical protein